MVENEGFQIFAIFEKMLKYKAFLVLWRVSTTLNCVSVNCLNTCDAFDVVGKTEATYFRTLKWI